MAATSATFLDLSRRQPATTGIRRLERLAVAGNPEGDLCVLHS